MRVVYTNIVPTFRDIHCVSIRQRTPLTNASLPQHDRRYI